MYNSLYGNSRILQTETLNLLLKISETTEDKCRSILGDEIFEMFVDLKYIVVCGEDERKQINCELEERRKKLATGCYYQRLHLSTTNKCNMNCAYCFCHTFEYKNETGISETTLRFPNQSMTFSVAKEAIEKSINTIKENNNDSLSVEFFGGEPLLNYKLIIDVLEYFGNGEKFGIKITYGCTTNGAYVADELLDYLEKYKVRVAMSIDYINYETGEFRGDGKLNITWDKIDKNIAKLLDHNVEVKFQSVLSEQTWDRYNYNLIDYAAEHNLKAIGLILSFDFEFYKKYTPEDISKKVLDINDYCVKKGVQFSGYWYLSFLGLIDPDGWSKRRDWKTCPTIGRLLSVEPNGDVYACKTTAKLLGNIDDFKGIFSGENYQYYAMRAYSNSPSCDGCEIEGVCSGNCAGAVENKFNDINNVDTRYCRTVKLIIRGLLERYLRDLKIEDL